MCVIGSGLLGGLNEWRKEKKTNKKTKRRIASLSFIVCFWALCLALTNPEEGGKGGTMVRP